MTNFRPIYRVIVYDTDDTTVLTPDSSAPHSDPFQVEDRENPTAGFKPYLGRVEWSGGKIDLLTSRWERGRIRVELLDQVTGRRNLERWVSAFFGDSAGRHRELGLLVKVFRSIDNGRTFVGIGFGRAQDIIGKGYLAFEFGLGDQARELDLDLFPGGKPHSSISYAFPAPLLPNGLIAALGTYGPFPTVDELPIVFSAAVGPIQAATPGGAATNQQVAARGGLLSVLGEPFIVGGANFPGARAWIFPWLSSPVEVWVDTGAASGRMNCKLVQTQDVDGKGDHRVDLLWLYPLYDADGNLDTGHPDYIALQSDGTTADMYIVSAGAPKDNVRFYIDDVHPMTFFRDILDGKFFRLNTDGTVKFTIPYDSAAFTSIIADLTIPPFRGIIEEAPRAQEFIERHLLRLPRLAFTRDSIGQIVPLDLRRPTSLSGLVTIGDAQRIESERPRWAHSIKTSISRVDVTMYQDTYLDHDGAPNRIHAIPFGPVRVLDIVGTVKLADNRHAIDAIGLRTTPHEFTDGLSRDAWVKAVALGYATEVRSIFGRGAPGLDLLLDAGDPVVDALTVGQDVFYAFDGLVDPSTHKKGGTRVGKIVEANPAGLALRVRLVDLGVNITSAVPTLGTVVKGSGGLSKTSIDFVISSLNAQGDPVRASAAVTAKSVSTRPLPSSALWHDFGLYAAAGTYASYPYRSNMRVWVRGRAEPDQATRLAFPSDWVYGAGVGYADLDAMTAPFALVRSSATVKAATFRWTNGEAAEIILIQIASPSGGTLEDLVRLPAGTKGFTVNGLDLLTGPDVKVAVMHEDAFGGVSTSVTSTFTPVATALTASAPGFILDLTLA